MRVFRRTAAANRRIEWYGRWYAAEMDRIGDEIYAQSELALDRMKRTEETQLMDYREEAKNLINRVVEGESAKDVADEASTPHKRVGPKKRKDPRLSKLAKMRAKKNKSAMRKAAKKGAKTKGKSFFKKLAKLRSSDENEIKAFMTENPEFEEYQDIIIDSDDETFDDLMAGIEDEE